MKVQQLVWTRDGGWPQPLEIPIVPGASLLFVFGDRASLTTAHATGALGALAPAAVMAGCSTAGQIAGGAIEDDCLVATLVTFDRTRVSSATVKATAATSREAGRELAQ